MADRIRYEDDSIDKTPSTENGWRVSYAYPNWKAVKDGKVGISHRNKTTVITWARKN